MKIDQQRMRDDHDIGPEVGGGEFERENPDRIVRPQETDFRIRPKDLQQTERSPLIGLEK
jgi:hypothetical protein